MKKGYRHLTFEKRIYLEVYRWESKSLSYIASRLNVSRSTISRELRRGRRELGRFEHTYRADLAEGRIRESNARKGRKRKIVGELERLVRHLIEQDWSPAQISGRLRLELGIRVSHETIYRYLKRDRTQGGSLHRHLRCGRRFRRRRFYVPRVRQAILNRIGIEHRPQVTERRQRAGDWERDLIFSQGRSQILLTLVDRKTRYTLIRRVMSASPVEVARKTRSALQGQPCRSLTNDNGMEFSRHEQEARRLGIPIYFTRPYASWERGTCENTNGLIRQYFPKRKPLEEMTHEKLQAIQERLNSRPRKTLGFRTPLEASRSGALQSLCQIQDRQEGSVALNS